MEDHSRTDRLADSPPIFSSGLLDFFTRVHPVIPALIFVPAIALMEWLAIDNGYSPLAALALTAVGLAIWTLVEYWLHRLLFHWQPSFRGGDRMHFMIHGVHHDHPNDKLRLVMPPAASIPLALIFYGLFLLIFGKPLAFPLFAGLLIGYLIYDYTHYYLHHAVPKSDFGKRLREQHMRHHFQDHRYGFGVSTTFWDAVFRTLPRKRNH